MADFELRLAPTWWGRISGPKMGYFQAVSGLFLVTSDFIIFGEIFETTLCPDQDYSGRHLDPHSPCKMTDFKVHFAPI